MLKTVTGRFQRPDGSPAANATIFFRLNQDATDAEGGGQVGRAALCMQLDDDGNLGGSGSLDGIMLESNDTLLPNGTYYVVRVVDEVFGEVFHQRMVLAGDSPINLNLISPA